MLIRGGVQQMTLFDGDAIEIGNLTRHTLSMNDIRVRKTDGLAQRLNSLNPHAEVASVPLRVTFTNEEASKRLLEHDLIIDCTANDELLHVLTGISFPHDVHFYSISIGFRAKRMFCFHAKDESFPVDEYISEMSAWIEEEQEEFKGETFPREGIGCYHPVFPARCDDMWLWGSVAVKTIAKGIDSSPSDPVLYVYEQNEEERGFVSIRRAIEVPAYE
jgi:molybdopterin/thiamine biosynthesis adenylyltransferase